MGHNHSLNYYAVYCPITIVANAVSYNRYQKNNKHEGFHAIGSSCNMTSLDSKNPSKKITPCRKSIESIRAR